MENDVNKEEPLLPVAPAPFLHDTFRCNITNNSVSGYDMNVSKQPVTIIITSVPSRAPIPSPSPTQAQAHLQPDVTVTLASPPVIHEKRKRVRRSPNLQVIQEHLNFNVSWEELKEQTMPALRQSVRTSGRTRQKVIHFDEAESDMLCDTTKHTTHPAPAASLRVKNAVKRSEAKPQTTVKRRRTKKLSKAEQLETTSNFLDVKRPSSVLTDTNLRALLNKASFQRLKPSNQRLLINLLPSVDRPRIDQSLLNESLRLNASSLNNEFFNRACIEWRERLAYGEFTNENQTKLKAEAEKDKGKIDPWKQRNFEYIWGEKNKSLALLKAAEYSDMFKLDDTLLPILQKSASEIKSNLENQQQANFEIPKTYIKEVRSKPEMKVVQKRLRSGAVTRSTSNYMKQEMETDVDVDVTKESFAEPTTSNAITSLSISAVEPEAEPQNLSVSVSEIEIIEEPSKPIEEVCEEVLETVSMPPTPPEPVAEQLEPEDQVDLPDLKTEKPPDENERPETPENYLPEKTCSLDNIPRDEMVPSPILERTETDEEEEQYMIPGANPPEHLLVEEHHHQWHETPTPNVNVHEESKQEESEEESPVDQQSEDAVDNVETQEEYPNKELEEDIKMEAENESDSHESLESEIHCNAVHTDPADSDETDDSSKVYNDTMLNEHDYLKNMMSVEGNQPCEPAVSSVDVKVENHFDSMVENSDRSCMPMYSTDQIDAQNVPTSAVTVPVNDVDFVIKKCVDFNQVSLKEPIKNIDSIDSLYDCIDHDGLERTFDEIECDSPQTSNQVTYKMTNEANSTVYSDKNVLLNTDPDLSEYNTTTTVKYCELNAPIAAEPVVNQPSIIVERKEMMHELIESVESEMKQLGYGTTIMSEEQEIYTHEDTQNVGTVNLLVPGLNCKMTGNKYIIEEASSSNNQPNTAPQTVNLAQKAQEPFNLSNQIYVTPTSFGYSLSTTKLDGSAVSPATVVSRQIDKIFKQEANNNQSAHKPRVIYEISPEPKVNYENSHFNDKYDVVMEKVNDKRTIIRTVKKESYIQSNNILLGTKITLSNNGNTILLSPIPNQTSPQPQAEILKPKRSHGIATATTSTGKNYMIRDGPHVQIVQQPLIKNNAVIINSHQLTAHTSKILIPQQLSSPQPQQIQQTTIPTVIRTPSHSPSAQQTAAGIQPVQPGKAVQKPIQKQKVIMSTSSLQQYRHYNQQKVPLQLTATSPVPVTSTSNQKLRIKTLNQVVTHQSRKQLHPQQIIHSTKILQAQPHISQMAPQLIKPQVLQTQQILQMHPIQSQVIQQQKQSSILISQTQQQHSPQQHYQVEQHMQEPHGQQEPPDKKQQQQIILAPQQDKQQNQWIPAQVQLIQVQQQQIQQQREQQMQLQQQQQQLQLKQEEKLKQDQLKQLQLQQQQQELQQQKQKQLEQQRRENQLKQQQQLELQLQQQREQQQLQQQREQQLQMQQQQQREQQQKLKEQQIQQQKLLEAEQQQKELEQQRKMEQMQLLQQQQLKLKQQQEKQAQQQFLQQQEKQAQQQFIQQQEKQAQQQFIQQQVQAQAQVQQQQAQQKPQVQQSLLQHQIPIISHTQLVASQQIDEMTKPPNQNQIPVILSTSSASITMMPSTSNAQNLVKRTIKLITNPKGRGKSSSSNKPPPPGSVNFERSYQICQAVIQNSPNRHQLNCQLKPPPSF